MKKSVQTLFLTSLTEAKVPIMDKACYNQIVAKDQHPYIGCNYGCTIELQFPIPVDHVECSKIVENGTQVLVKFLKDYYPSILGILHKGDTISFTFSPKTTVYVFKFDIFYRAGC
jgi:hypothetical protein